VKEVVDLFFAEWGRGSWSDTSAAGEPREANILRLSIDKALWRLGWQPAWDIHETLRQTARWYQAYLEESGSMQSLCLQQISEYEQAFEKLVKFQEAGEG